MPVIRGFGPDPKIFFKINLIFFELGVYIWTSKSLLVYVSRRDAYKKLRKRGINND